MDTFMNLVSLEDSGMRRKEVEKLFSVHKVDFFLGFQCLGQSEAHLPLTHF